MSGPTYLPPVFPSYVFVFDYSCTQKRLSLDGQSFIERQCLVPSRT